MARKNKFGFKTGRAGIKAYRAAGKMFGQTFHTGRNAGKGYRPEDKFCERTGYVVSWYSDPCPCGRTFKDHPIQDSEEIGGVYAPLLEHLREHGGEGCTGAERDG